MSPDLWHVIQACLKKTPAQRPGLIELANMIASAGPPAQATLGSFWPEPVAKLQIVAARASTTPETQVQDGRVPDEVATPALVPTAVPPATIPVLPDVLRRPAAAGRAVPRTVRDAVRLMCLGFAVTLADLILSLMVLGRYNNEVTLAQQASLAQAERTANYLAGAMAIGVAADFVGLAGWAWLAVACRRAPATGRGNGAARHLLGLHAGHRPRHARRSRSAVRDHRGLGHRPGGDRPAVVLVGQCVLRQVAQALTPGRAGPSPEPRGAVAQEAKADRQSRRVRMH